MIIAAGIYTCPSSTLHEAIARSVFALIASAIKEGNNSYLLDL